MDQEERELLESIVYSDLRELTPEEKTFIDSVLAGEKELSEEELLNLPFEVLNQILDRGAEFKWTFYGIIIKYKYKVYRLTSDYYIEMFCHDLGIDPATLVRDKAYSFDNEKIKNIEDYKPEEIKDIETFERYWNSVLPMTE